MRLGLVLAEIGEKAGVQVSDDEMQRALFDQVRRFPGQQQQIFEFYRNKPGAAASTARADLRGEGRRPPAGRNRVTDKKVTKEELMAEEEGEAKAEAKKAAPKKKAAAKAEAADAVKATKPHRRRRLLRRRRRLTKAPNNRFFSSEVWKASPSCGAFFFYPGQFILAAYSIVFSHLEQQIVALAYN